MDVEEFLRVDVLKWCDDVTATTGRLPLKGQPVTKVVEMIGAGAVISAYGIREAGHFLRFVQNTRNRLNQKSFLRFIQERVYDKW